jgi:hypothetical protein
VGAVATTGGSGNYEYRIDSGVYPMAHIYGIASGTHTIYVRDIRQRAVSIDNCNVATSYTNNWI